MNGQCIQWGPAPCDPRFQDSDPLNFTELLVAGKNVIGIEVLYFGHGDGTWPMGKPGLIFRLDMEYANGNKEQVISD